MLDEFYVCTTAVHHFAWQVPELIGRGENVTHEQ